MQTLVARVHYVACRCACTDGDETGVPIPLGPAKMIQLLRDNALLVHFRPGHHPNAAEERCKCCWGAVQLLAVVLVTIKKAA